MGEGRAESRTVYPLLSEVDRREKRSVPEATEGSEGVKMSRRQILGF